MDELQIAGPYGQPIVLFPGAVAPPVYTQLAVLTNPSNPGQQNPASVTLYESDRDANAYILLRMV